jgi:hypothetical protein
LRAASVSVSLTETHSASPVMMSRALAILSFLLVE